MKKVWKIGRLTTLMVSLPSVLVGLLFTIIAMLWWQLIGAITVVLGGQGRKFVGRWLGCYPFVYVLLVTLWLAAWFHWGATGEKIKPFFARLCANCLDKVEGDKGLAKIGGLW